MNAKTILQWAAFVVGEAILVAAFFLWRGDAQTSVFALNLTVSTVIYFMSFVDILFPWLKTGDKSHRIFGSLGIRWFATGLYSVLAIAAMIVAGVVFDWNFEVQLIIQGVLLFLLLLGFVAVANSSDKVAKVFEEQEALKSGVLKIKDAVSKLLEESIATGLPEDVVSQVSDLNDEIRYISPSNNPEAAELEAQLLSAVSKIRSEISNYRLNEKNISEDLSAAKRICKKRKSVYSM